MNKSALKTFATNARRELLKKVEAKAMKIGITEDNIKKADIESSDAIFIDGRQLSKEEKTQRDRLIERINQIGFKRVMEEVAYTWFNRFTALRFMEVNDYLPTKVRVLSSTNSGSTEPDMMKEALSLDLDLDKEYIYELKMNNNSEELFKYLIIKHCNDLNQYLPFMFETIDDYTEILFPEGLLATDSFVRHMTNTEEIPEDNWKKVEVIGWLYQYYISDEKDRVVKAKKKYKTEEIPFATQLFTPDWIVRYMVQNSLGRYWVESRPEHRDLLSNWEFYLENPNPEPDFESKLAPYINKELKVEDIKCFDPAMGSGHILVYMFDVLYEIYSKSGYMEREIPKLIIENNLYGLDIDDRAYQLACFSVVMRALEYNNRFLRTIKREGLELNLASIQESNMLSEEEIGYLVGEKHGEIFENTKSYIEQFTDAKTYGSLIQINQNNIEYLEKRIRHIQANPADDLFEEESRKKVLNLVPLLLKQSKIMVNEYDVLVTNPPYMGNRYLPTNLSKYLASNYPYGKMDIFSAFMFYSFSKVKRTGQIGFMTPNVWMFISSYEELRGFILDSQNISSLVHLSTSGFADATVHIVTFTMRNTKLDLTGEYIRLTEFTGVEQQKIKTFEAIENPSVNYRFSTKMDVFRKIPKSPIAYWASDTITNVYERNNPIKEVATLKAGIKTGNNELFLRLWHEVPYTKIGFNMEGYEDISKYGFKWFPYNKGGAFRKWYGNNDYVINMEDNARDIKALNNDPRLRDSKYYFKKSITWSFISSSKFGVRYSPGGFLFDVSGSSVLPKEEDIFYMLGFLCSEISFQLLKIQNPTLNYQVENISDLPLAFPRDGKIRGRIEELVKKNIEISREDWDFFETSWEFNKHPLIIFKEKSVEQSFIKWLNYSNEKFEELRQNEEEINRLLLEIYELNDEMEYKVSDRDVTVNKADRERDIISFISYAVGCMFGRYSVDKDGLICAGGKLDQANYQTFKPDEDNILPILPGAYFDDDIVSRFIKFVEITFGSEALAENLEYIAETLGKKKEETVKETIGRYFLTNFFKDHIQIYRKRPIYWLFTSGKEKAFNCLIYIHRYDKTTLSRIRTDYLHDYQIRLDAEKKDLLNIIEGDSTAKEISNAKKELKSLEKKIDELKAYDELLHHMADMQIEIDLDDGVKVNYEKFKGLVAKI